MPDKVSSDVLALPDTWAPMTNPLEAMLVELPEGHIEREDAIRSFRETMPKAQVMSVHRVQSPAVWEAYAARRHTFSRRGIKRFDQRRYIVGLVAPGHNFSTFWCPRRKEGRCQGWHILCRYERKLFHGCPGDKVRFIAQQGFNRSYSCATSRVAVYGKGVYFARFHRVSPCLT